MNLQNPLRLSFPWLSCSTTVLVSLWLSKSEIIIYHVPVGFAPVRTAIHGRSGVGALTWTRIYCRVHLVTICFYTCIITPVLSVWQTLCMSNGSSNFFYTDFWQCLRETWQGPRFWSLTLDVSKWFCPEESLSNPPDISLLIVKWSSQNLVSYWYSSIMSFP